MDNRPTISEFRKKALENPEIKAEYDALSSEYEMKRKMIAMRKAAGLTQDQMAKQLGTQKSNISRLESINSESSPRLSTIQEYAKILGYSVKIDFEPHSINN